MEAVLMGSKFLTGETLSTRFLHGLGLVKEKTAHGFLNVLAQCVPSVALREDVFGQALGAMAAVLFLCHFKHQFFHGVNLRRWRTHGKRGVAGNRDDWVTIKAIQIT
jgi:hypothetical protein